MGIRMTEWRAQNADERKLEQLCPGFAFVVRYRQLDFESDAHHTIVDMLRLGAPLDASVRRFVFVERYRLPVVEIVAWHARRATLSPARPAEAGSDES